MEGIPTTVKTGLSIHFVLVVPRYRPPLFTPASYFTLNRSARPSSTSPESIELDTLNLHLLRSTGQELQRESTRWSGSEVEIEDGDCLSLLEGRRS
ncbi:hypothetical protein L1887_14712 [Cichorium endivia]|nr:hypothetical protein L1887_14712 [Cichorium endivia]